MISPLPIPVRPRRRRALLPGAYGGRIGPIAVAVGLAGLVLLSTLVLGAVADGSPAVAARVASALAHPRPAVPTSNSSKVITLLPEPASVGSWCGYGNASSKYPTSARGFLALEGNLFNLSANSTGGATLCYHAANGTLTDSVDVYTPGARLHKELGFPAAILGQNIYGGTAGITNPALPLPASTVANLTSEDLWSSVNYSVTPYAKTPYDFAFDDWLTTAPANGTIGRNPGDRIEVMVWFSDDIGLSGLPQTKVTLPSYQNGSVVRGAAWYRDQGCQDNGSQITFDYLYSPTGSPPGYGLPRGQVAVNMTAVLDNVENYTRTNPNGTCWAPAGTNISAMHVDEFPIGAEFYPNNNSKSLDYDDLQWSVSSWCYTLVAGAPTPDGVGCHPSGDTLLPVHPVAAANVTAGIWPLDVGFSANVTGGAAPFNYTWAFGPDLGVSYRPATNYTYWLPGTYVANVTVVDYDDIAVSSNLTITVEPLPALTAELEATPLNVSIGETFELVATVSGGRLPYAYSWWGLPAGTGCASENAPTLNCTPTSNGTWTIVVGVSASGGYTQASTTVTVVSPTSASNSTRNPPPPSSPLQGIPWLPSPASITNPNTEVGLAVFGAIIATVTIGVVVMRRLRHSGR